MGNLIFFVNDLNELFVELNYLSWFLSVGLMWQVVLMYSLGLSYGCWINCLDYNVLNFFNNQLSQFLYEKGNLFLQLEIVNNMELSYILKYCYNFKLGYSCILD